VTVLRLAVAADPWETGRLNLAHYPGHPGIAARGPGRAARCQAEGW
jgi:hypothetical protein